MFFGACKTICNKNPINCWFDFTLLDSCFSSSSWKGEKLAFEYISQAFKLHYRIFRIFSYGMPGFPAPIFMNYERLAMFLDPLFKAFYLAAAIAGN